MTLYPNSAALILAEIFRTELAASEMSLYKAIAAPISPSTVIADITEADYAGYAAKAIANWLPPYLDPAGGASIQSGTQQFDWGPGPGLDNVILGWYLLNAGGDLIAIGNFSSPIAMAGLGDSIPNNVTLNFGAPIS